MNKDLQTQPIHPASNTARGLLAALAILMSVAIFFSDRFAAQVGQWVAEDPDQVLKRFDVLVAWLAVFSLPLLAGGVLTIRNGHRAVVSGRFPPVGMWTIVATPVETGSRARLRGRLLQVAGLCLCLIAAGFPFALWYIMHSVVGDG